MVALVPAGMAERYSSLCLVWNRSRIRACYWLYISLRLLHVTHDLQVTCFPALTGHVFYLHVLWGVFTCLCWQYLFWRWYHFIVSSLKRKMSASFWCTVLWIDLHVCFTEALKEPHLKGVYSQQDWCSLLTILWVPLKWGLLVKCFILMVSFVDELDCTF